MLDLGCGTGYLASVLAERVGPGGRVTGVDPSRERILLAESKYVQHNNLQFMDKSSEDFPAGPYDIVFCNFVLHWIQDKQTVFRRVHENLKSGGLFAFLCPAKPASSVWEQLNPEIDHVHHFGTTDEYTRLAELYGFQVEFTAVDSVQHVFDSVDLYIEWMQASVNVASCAIDPGVMEEVKNKLGTKPHMEWTRIIYILRKV